MGRLNARNREQQLQERVGGPRMECESVQSAIGLVGSCSRTVLWMDCT